MTVNPKYVMARILVEVDEAGFPLLKTGVLHTEMVHHAMVDLESRDLIFQSQQWSDFARRWVAERRRRGRPAHYCMLALAMARADGQAKGWDYYLQHAARSLADVFYEDEMVRRSPN